MTEEEIKDTIQSEEEDTNTENITIEEIAENAESQMSEMKETMAEGGVTDDSVKEMVSKINWDIVQYEDPEEYIPVFTKEDYEILDKFGDMSPRTFLEINLQMLREKVSEINTEEFQLKSDEEKKKHIDDIIDTRNVCIGVVQESVSHYNELMSKNNINQLDSFIMISVFSKVVKKYIGEMDLKTVDNTSIYSLLFKSALSSISKKTIYSGSTIGTKISYLDSVSKYLSTINKNNKAYDLVSVTSKTNTLSNVIVNLYESIKSDTVDKKIEEMGFSGYESEIKHLIDEIGKLKKEFHEKIVKKYSDDVIRVCVDPVKKQIESVLKSDKNLESIKVKNGRKLATLSYYVDTLYHIISDESSDICLESIYDIGIILNGIVFNETLGFGITKNFYVSSNAQFYYFMSLIQKYVNPKMFEIDNINEKIKDVVIKNEEYKKDIERICDEKQFLEEVTEFLFNNMTYVSFYSSLFEILASILHNTENSLRFLLNDEMYDDFLTNLCCGSIYMNSRRFFDNGSTDNVANNRHKKNKTKRKRRK